MIIDDFDIGRTSFAPRETNAPVVIDANGILARPLALQRLQTVCGRRAEIVQDPRLIEKTQLPQRTGLHVYRRSLAGPARPDERSFAFGEAMDNGGP
jgi:hypothetical protein